MSDYTIIYVSFYRDSCVFINSFMKITKYFDYISFKITIQLLDSLNYITQIWNRTPPTKIECLNFLIFSFHLKIPKINMPWRRFKIQNV